MKTITLEIRDDYYEFAQEQSEMDGFLDTDKYLGALLNMALLNSITDWEAWKNLPPPLPLILSMPKEYRTLEKVKLRYRDANLDDERTEDPGDGVWNECDLDDDIPF